MEPSVLATSHYSMQCSSDCVHACMQGYNCVWQTDHTVSGADRVQRRLGLFACLGFSWCACVNILPRCVYAMVLCKAKHINSPLASCQKEYVTFAPARRLVNHMHFRFAVVMLAKWMRALFLTLCAMNVRIDNTRNGGIWSQQLSGGKRDLQQVQWSNHLLVCIPSLGEGPRILPQTRCIHGIMELGVSSALQS